MISLVFCHAQQVQQYVFTHLTTSAGLSTNNVTSIIQDKKGFIWAGTYNGLQRYDGSNFINFKNDRNNPSSLLYNIIGQLCEDGKGNIWILFANGKVGIFNTTDYSCTEVGIEAPEEVQLQLARHLFKDRAGNIHLMVQRFGLYGYDAQSRKFSYKKATVTLPSKWTLVNVYYETKANRFWINCDSGMLMYNADKQSVNYRGHNADKNPVIDKFSSYKFCGVTLVDAHENYWVETWPPDEGIPQVFEYNISTGKNIAHQPSIYNWVKGYHELVYFLEQRDGTVWIAGNPVLACKRADSEGLTFIPNAEKNEFSLYFDYMNDILEDNEKNLWIATDKGIFIFNPARQYFKSVSTSRQNPAQDFSVVSIKELSNGEIWAGTWGGGIFSFDNKFNPLNDSKAHNAEIKPVAMAWSIREVKSGEIWIGCQSAEINIYNPATKTRKTLHPPIFKNRTITDIVQDHNGNLWFCLFNGTVIKWDAKKAVKNIEDGFVYVNDFAGTAHKVICDKQGFIWVSTDGEGLKKFDPQTNEILESYTSKGTEDSRTITPGVGDIMQYNDSIILFTEDGIGVLNIYTKKIKHITAEDGLPTTATRGIIKDKDGILWITSVDNLCRYNYEKNIFSVYSIKDGLINKRFTMGVHALLRDGRIALGTEHDVVVFNPSDLVKEAKAPTPVITEVLVNNNFRYVDAIMKAGKLKLDYQDNSLMILFTALRYQAQEKLIYYHRLEGLDKDWVRTDIRNEAVYNYLKPGTYTFKVKCSDENGNVSGITSFTIQVVAPFWKTNWFYGMLILIAVAVFYWMDKERLKRIFTLQQVRTQIADNLCNEMSKTLNDINILSEISKLKADKDIERSKEYIDQINTKSRRMIEVMDDMLWSIDPVNDSMEKTLSRFGEQTEGLSTAAETPVELIVDSKVKGISLDMKVRHELLIIYKEALQVILQYPTNVPVIVNVELKKQVLSIIMHTVIEKHYYEHLYNSTDFIHVKDLAKQLNAELDVQTDRNHTAIIIQLPVR